jgi:adenylate kinase
MARILLAGPQGSGKTTQAEIVAPRLGFGVIKVGDLLRDFAEGESEESRETKRLLAAGGFVDDRVTARLVKKAMEDQKVGAVADGYPRRMSQIALFDPHYDLVVDLHIGDEEAIQRLLDRGRSDDTLEGIKQRLAWFHSENEPVLDYYRQQGILVDVDGLGSIEEVTQRVMKVLEDKGYGQTKS